MKSTKIALVHLPLVLPSQHLEVLKMPKVALCLPGVMHFKFLPTSGADVLRTVAFLLQQKAKTREERIWKVLTDLYEAATDPNEQPALREMIIEKYNLLLKEDEQRKRTAGNSVFALKLSKLEIEQEENRRM